MHQLSGIFFHVDARDADIFFAALAVVNLQISAQAQRLVVLRNLVAFGQIGIKIIFRSNFENSKTFECNAKPTIRTMRIASALAAGNVPGWPKQTGQTLEFGSLAPGSLGHEQNIFDAVLSSQCISSPIIGIYSIIQNVNIKNQNDSLKC
jgi:hypothetical protein